MPPLPPAARIGILGGGQLGRMLSGAAARLGFDTVIYAPDEDTPAARVAAKGWVGAYDNTRALKRFAADCDVITFEFENVPVETVRILEAAGAVVRPGAKSLEISQDRLTEKTFLNEHGIETVAFEKIDSADKIAPALAKLGGDGFLKRRHDGYDGKGQVRLKTGDDAAAAFKQLGEAPCILEAAAPFKLEISSVIARTDTGEIAAFDPSENQHDNGILRACILPAPITNEHRAEARARAASLAEALGHIGVLALEFFVMDDGRLLANEFAPRVHNSGHWTPEACVTGQFEQHIRAIAGWPLGDTRRLHNIRMDNLLGEESTAAAGEPGVTLYGKREPRAGRKMGHKVVLTGPATES